MNKGNKTPAGPRSWEQDGEGGAGTRTSPWPGKLPCRRHHQQVTGPAVRRPQGCEENCKALRNKLIGWETSYPCENGEPVGVYDVEQRLWGLQVPPDPSQYPWTMRKESQSSKEEKIDNLLSSFLDRIWRNQ